jgi:predicted secreted protein
MDTRDATTKGSSGSRDLLEATKSGTISVSALYADDAAYGVSDLMTAWSARTTLAVKFSTEVSGDSYWSADAYITSLEVNAGMEDNVTYSATFELTGTITYTTVA